MPEEVIQQNRMEPSGEAHANVRSAKENPMILDKVEYVYSSYAQFIVSSLDFRIALGDRIPPSGNVKPVVGIVMSHDHARAFLEAMAANIAKLDNVLAKIKQMKTAPEQEQLEGPPPKSEAG